MTMSFDGLPLDLQSLSSKICIFSLKSWTLILKMNFSLYRPVKIGPQAIKISAENSLSHKNMCPVWWNRRPNVHTRWPKNVASKGILWLENRGPNWWIRCRIETSWNSELCPF